MKSGRRLIAVFVALCLLLNASSAWSWGGRGHRIVAAIAMILLPRKAAKIENLLANLEVDGNFVDAASYPDDYVRDHDPQKQFNRWHYANLPDNNEPFNCGVCLFTALNRNLAVIRSGKSDYAKAVAIAWVMHLVGDLHQPLHMSGRDGSVKLTYRGQSPCGASYGAQPADVVLHSVWDVCLVEELAQGKDPVTVANELLGGITTYRGRPEIDMNSRTPWIAWGNESHVLANSVAFDSLQPGDDLQDSYINPALETVRKQLLAAGIRLAYLLDRNFK